MLLEFLCAEQEKKIAPEKKILSPLLCMAKHFRSILDTICKRGGGGKHNWVLQIFESRTHEPSAASEENPARRPPWIGWEDGGGFTQQANQLKWKVEKINTIYKKKRERQREIHTRLYRPIRKHFFPYTSLSRSVFAIRAVVLRHSIADLRSAHTCVATRAIEVGNIWPKKN